MIVECPQCKTAHSKSEQELSGGGPLVCRRCGASFEVPAGVGAVEPAAAAVKAPAGGVPVPELALDFGVGAPPARAPSPASFGPLGPGRGPAAVAGKATTLDLGLEGGLPWAPAAAPGGIDLGTAGVPRKAPASAPPAKDPGKLAIDFADPPNAAGLRSAAPPGIAAFEAGLASASVGLSPSPAGPYEQAPSGAKGKVPAPGTGGQGPADATEIRPRGQATRTDGSAPGWPDSPTDVIKAAALHKRLEQMRAPDDDPVRTRPYTPGARGNVFPRETWLRLGSEMVAYVRAGSTRVKLAAAGAVLVPVVLAVVVLTALLGSHERDAFLLDRQPLLSGPQGGEVYPQLAPVDRGALVEVLDEVGEFALVRDALGRVGYVRAASLRTEAPPAVPNQPFADCARAPVEASIDRCLARAHAQFDSCREVCSGGSEDPGCLEHCQRRFSDCQNLCEQAGDGGAAVSVPSGPAPRAPSEVRTSSEPAPEPRRKTVKRAAKKKKKGR